MPTTSFGKCSKNYRLRETPAELSSASTLCPKYHSGLKAIFWGAITGHVPAKCNFVYDSFLRTSP